MSSTVLVTGATGHVGFRTLVYALEAGYNVRAAIRSRPDAILSSPSIKALNPGSKLTFVTVPDLTAPGAYDEAVKGVDYIIHLASPIVQATYVPADKYDEVYTQPALQGTLGMLESAAKQSSVKRIVITSSVVAIIPFSNMVQPGDLFDASSRTPTPSPPFQYGDFEAYCASKIAALNGTESWVAERKGQLNFDVIHIHPSFVLGANELTDTITSTITSGTNATVARIVLGKKNAMPLPSMTVHLDDAALAHVRALDPNVAGNQSFITSSHSEEGVDWQRATEIVQKAFPDAVKQGILSTDGTQDKVLARADTSKTTEQLGIHFKSYEEQVKSIVGQILELEKKPGQKEELEQLKASFATA
jgi:nucleoside-diphosphate-sugar epimerase